MSDTPPSDPRDDRVSGTAPEPFVRGRIVWGRPPETVFRAGPLPRAPQTWAQPAPRLAVPPAATHAATNIFTGSMIPRAAPAPEPEPLPGESPLAPEPESLVVPVGAKPRRARKSPRAAEPVPPSEVEVAPEETPVVEAYSEPEPTVEPIVEPERVRSTAAPRPTVEIVVEPEAPEQIETLPPPLSNATAGPSDPRAMPSVVVTPTLYARVEAVLETVKSNDRWRIAAIVGAVVVTGGFIWLATLPAANAPSLDMDAPPPAAPGAQGTLPLDAAPVPAGQAEPPPGVAEIPADTAPATRSEPVASPARPAATRAAPTVTPRATPPVTDSAPPPVIETAPLVVESPTAAAPAPTDPDAPIETRPQPLN